MVVIKNYITEDDGTTTVVIKGVELDNKTSLLLDNGYEVEADVRVVDPFKITDKQRRKIFALCNDIEAYTGQPRDYMRYLFMDYVEVLYGYEKRLSLSDCTREQAKQIIEVILDWVFHNNIPLNYKTSDLLKNDKAFLYWSTFYLGVRLLKATNFQDDVTYRRFLHPCCVVIDDVLCIDIALHNRSDSFSYD